MKVLVIIPAYNESETISQVIDSLKDLPQDVDYIVINDCSTDNEEEILNEISAEYISLPVNLGIGGAVQTGYLYAMKNHYDIAIQIDGDGQHDPKYIKNIIEPIIKGEADMVIGSRFIKKEGFQSSGLRRTGIKFLSFLIRTTCGVRISDVTSGFRATNLFMTDIFSKEYAQDYPEPEAIVSCIMHGGVVKEVPVIMKEREGGVSSIHSFKSFYYMIKVSISILIKRFSMKKNIKGAI